MPSYRENMRHMLKTKRSALNAATIEQDAKKIFIRLLAQAEWQIAQHIGIYYAVNKEVPTQSLIENSWKSGKQVYLPVVQDGKRLHFAAYQAHTQLKLNCYGIAEPKNSYFIPAEKLDLVIVPLLGFDEKNQRLGSGAGYYDRTFAFLNTTTRPKKPVLIGLAYKFQRVDNLLTEAWDISLDQVITE